MSNQMQYQDRDFTRPPLRNEPADPCCFYTLYVGDAPDGVKLRPREKQICQQTWQYRYDQVIQDDGGRGTPHISLANDYALWVATSGLLYPESLGDTSAYTPCIYTPGNSTGCQTDLFNTTLISRDYCNTLTCYVRCCRPSPPPKDLMLHVDAELDMAAGKEVNTNALPPLPPKHVPGEPVNHKKELETLLAMFDRLDAHREIQINKSQQRTLLFARHSDTLTFPPDMNTWLTNFASVCTVLTEPRTKEVVKLYCWPKGCEVIVNPVENLMAEVMVRDHSDCPLIDTPRLMHCLLPHYKPKYGAVAGIMSTNTVRGMIGGEDNKQVPSAAAAAASVKGAAKGGKDKAAASAKKAVSGITGGGKKEKAQRKKG